MFSATLPVAAALLSVVGLATAQTSTDCNPLAKTCPNDPAVGGTYTYDFTKTNGKPDDWSYAEGTTIEYDSTNGAIFYVNQTGNAPVMEHDKYIMFGKITAVMRAAPGHGIVSSFILESDDLDEIDLEWIGSQNSAVQSNFFGKGNTTTYDRGGTHAVTDPVGTFQTYTIEWTKDQITWSIGTTAVRTLAFADPKALGGQNYPQTPMKVRMGNWIGCASVAAETDPKTEGTCQWADGAASLPGSYAMYVQSVTIQDYGCASEYKYGDNSGSYQSIQSIGKCAGGSVSVTSAAASTSSAAASSSTGTVEPISHPVESGSATTSADSSSATKAANGSSTTTTLSTVTSSTGVSKTTGTSTTASSTSTSPAQQSANAASANHIGSLNVAIAGVAAGLGYLML